MASKKTSKSKKKKIDNSKIIIPVVLIVAIIAVVLIILFTPNPVIKDCTEYCIAHGFEGSTNSKCVVFPQCMAPNYPLTDEFNEYCKGDFDVCCCKQ